MRQSGQDHRRAQERAGWIILFCLFLIAAGVFARQFSFNPAVLVARAAVSDSPLNPSKPGNEGRPPWLPEVLEQVGVPEQFTPETLYEKIDGKAELYLSTGFVQLNCRRFSRKGHPDHWCEWFAYTMAGVPQAFSAFTVQRRAEAQPLAQAQYGYQTQNALFFLCGSNYVEFIASEPNEELLAAMVQAAGSYLAAHSGESTQLPQIKWLPAQAQVAGSFTLQSSDVFGFDQFKDVFTAEYKLDGVELTAFVTGCKDPASAAQLSTAYHDFLIANGGKAQTNQNVGPTGEPIELMGTWEFVFATGSFVAGIHAAPSPGPAVQLATRVHQQLQSLNP